MNRHTSQHSHRPPPRRTPVAGARAATVLAGLTAAGLMVLGAGCGGRDAQHNRANLSLTADRLLTEYPWLSDTSKHWRQEADLAAGDIPDYSHLGCFPLGNGRLFTTSGLEYPFGTMSNIFGPVYQKRQGSLGRQRIVLIVRGKARELPRQQVEWVLRAGTVHTRLGDADGVRLDIYDCVPPSGPTIARVIAVTNDSDRTLKEVALAVAHNAGVLGPEGGILTSDGLGRSVRIGFVGSRTDAKDEIIAAPLPEAAQQVNRGGVADVGCTCLCAVGALRPGESVAKIAYTIIAPSTQEAEKETQRLEKVGFDVLKETYDWWQDWYSDALTITCPDERINEFIPIQQHIVRVQQAESGGYSPMYMYTTCWVRDSNGPIRFMTQTGKFEEVKRYLDYYYACSAQAGRAPMNFPLDVAIEGPLPEVNWAKAPVERAEVSSFIILQHYWYWRQSGDLTPVKEHWEYLRTNLLGQQVDDQGRLPFHGDETYRFPGYAIFEHTESEPTDWISMDLMSADSAWEFIAAAGAMCDWATMLGKPDEAREFTAAARKVRDALDRLYWMEDRGYYAPAMSDFSGEPYRYPFANINLRPQWLAAGLNWWAPDTDRSAQPSRSALAALQWLWKDSGTVKTTPGCGYYVGMTPGLALWSLADADHVSAPEAIEGLLGAASPSGGYAEMNKPDDTPSDNYWGKNRIRPWEGGMNAEAVVFALTGLRPNGTGRAVAIRPRLPFGWDRLSVTNLACGEGRLELTVLRDSEGPRIRAFWDGDEPLAIDLPQTKRLELGPGDEASVLVPQLGEADFSSGQPLRPPKKQFHYGEPAFAGNAKTIVVTWSKDTLQGYAWSVVPLGNDVFRTQPSTLEPGWASIDTKIAFPPEYLAAALYDKAGKRRADRLILDVEKYPGHCKTAAFWTEGEGKKIIDRFVELGGKVEKAENPREKPGDIFGA